MTITTQALDDRQLFRSALFSMFLSAAIVLSFFEAVYLPPLAIPGAKLGIASVITLIAMIFFKPKEVIAMAVIRVLVVGLVTGTIFTSIIIFSFLAAVISTLLMLLTYKFLYGRLSFVGISMIGGVSHNLVQLLIAIPLVATKAVLVHMPLLIIAGCLTGLINGIFANLIATREDIKYIVFSKLEETQNSKS